MVVVVVVVVAAVRWWWPTSLPAIGLGDGQSVGVGGPSGSLFTSRADVCVVVVVVAVGGGWWWWWWSIWVSPDDR